MVTRPEGVPDEPDLKLLDGVVAPRVLDAMKAAHEALQRLGIPHAIVGGLAVGAWGHPRATKDVDFLVRQSDAFHSEGAVITFKNGVPIEAAGVPVDYLTVESLHLTRAPDLTREGKCVPLEILFLLKLKAHRMQDEADVVALVKKGADAGGIERWLRAEGHGPEAERLRRLVERAKEES